MSRPMVIRRVRVWDHSGEPVREEVLSEDSFSRGASLPVTSSRRDGWVRYDNGERAWVAHGLPFMIDFEELD